MNPTEIFVQARDFLIAHREDYAAAYSGFQWPVFDEFNWALDFFDALAEGNDRPALWLVDESGAETRLSFAQMRERSNRVANFLRGAGVRRGDRVLVMLPNAAPLWEITLAVMKLGAVISPATTQLAGADLQDRISRGDMRHVITDEAGTDRFEGIQGAFTRIATGNVAGWIAYAGADSAPPVFTPDGPTRATDPFLLYFTSGTTAKPKIVLHTHQSYPAGHLSTRYWIGLQEGDVHLNISSPGWAKHAWSNFFAPFNAGATVFVYNYARFNAKRLLEMLATHRITTLCAPPTVWRMLILENLQAFPVHVREALSAGEPLNPEVIEKVRQAWGTTIRDGYGQTETTAQIGNSPGQKLKPGSMGRPMPGIGLPWSISRAGGRQGQVCIKLAGPDRPDGRLRRQPGAQRRAARRRLLPDLGRGQPRRRRLLLVCGPGRRRVQELRLPDQPVRARERVDRAPGGGRSRGGAEPRSDPAGGAEGLSRAPAGGRAHARHGPGHLPLPARAAGALQARAPAGILGPAEDHLGQDPAGGVARGRDVSRGGWRAPAGRVLGGGFPELK
jgi:acyl-CoA synthetase (AMP-forming)/AMP-acid ligase II